MVSSTPTQTKFPLPSTAHAPILLKDALCRDPLRLLPSLPEGVYLSGYANTAADNSITTAAVSETTIGRVEPVRASTEEEAEEQGEAGVEVGLFPANSCHGREGDNSLQDPE